MSDRLLASLNFRFQNVSNVEQCFFGSMIGVKLHKLFQDIMHCLCLLLNDAQALNPMNTCEELSPQVWFQRGQQFSVARLHVYFWHNMSTRSTSLFAMIAGSFSRTYRFVFQQGL